MRKKTTRSGRRGLNVSMHPLTPDEALRAVLAIKPEDAKRVIEKSKTRTRTKTKPKSQD